MSSTVSADTASGEKQPHHRVRKTLITLIALIAAVIIGFNMYIRVSSASFYSEATAEFPVPDSHSGFVVQDLDHVDKANLWLFSGYTHNKDVTPVIRRDAAGTVSKVYVRLLNGQLYGKQHGSGITSTDDYTFLTTDSGYVVISTDDIVNAQDGDTVDVIDERELGLAPAFLSISNGVLYTGEFYFPKMYETPLEHRLTTPDGKLNPAIMYAFDADPDGFYGFSTVPSRIYSIPDAVQGICVTDEGNIVLSSSWGISNSHLLVYDQNALAQSGYFDLNTLDAQGNKTLIAKSRGDITASDEKEIANSIPSQLSIPLYFLDSSSLIEDMVAPPMSEGITTFEGRVYIPNESASNKYIFGKLLWGADMVYSIDL